MIYPDQAFRYHAAALLLGLLATLPAARAATPAELLAGYSTQAGAAASAERGRAFFTTAASGS